MLKLEDEFASIKLETAIKSSTNADAILQEIQEANRLVHSLQDNGLMLLSHHRKALLFYQQIKSMVTMESHDISSLSPGILEFLHQWKIILMNCGQSLKYVE